MYNQQPARGYQQSLWVLSQALSPFRNNPLWEGGSMRNGLAPAKGSSNAGTRISRTIGVLALACFLGVSVQNAGAQTAMGSMVGNVTDASGSAVPGATVKITNAATNDSRNAESNEL